MMHQFNPFTLEGKTILVVGASSGIGREIAIECSKMGAQLIISARNADKLKSCLDEMSGDNNRYIPCDITKQEDLSTLIEQIPKIDGLVVTAGKSFTQPVQFATREMFDDVYNLNLFANIEVVRFIFKKKKINKEGSIVFLSSIAGDFRCNPGNMIYGTSKSALNAFVRYAAIEFSPRKIRVNAICPGMVYTDLISYNKITEEDYKKEMEKYPLKRYGEVEDIAPAAIYLLSQASSWMTGQTMVIDGGISIK